MLLSQKYDHIAVHYIHLWALVYLLPPVEKTQAVLSAREADWGGGGVGSEGWGGYPSLR